ncbi:aa3-type cytochrome c oxidase subunit IV [Consotaella salsifontis]|uniref:Aa3 type cytochrome c oxidase subunit IV n=1 Tax=Consotaella salsifontis TaxID=1365950 RepID=A0A1T4NM16_9HYPH|nr:aa3-type cytochrome c oxidase subunit IV [Consotaella salsifontis]SJZ80156.1 aa3 type cytochrome c oxidase subunit IV [Consotaella salsifontis]
MAEHARFEMSTAAQMDYPEHERTYSLFLKLLKWGSIAVASLLIAMAFGFVGGGGFFGGVISFVVVLAIAYFVAR